LAFVAGIEALPDELRDPTSCQAGARVSSNHPRPGRRGPWPPHRDLARLGRGASSGAGRRVRRATRRTGACRASPTRRLSGVRRRASCGGPVTEPSRSRNHGRALQRTASVLRHPRPRHAPLAAPRFGVTRPCPTPVQPHAPRATRKHGGLVGARRQGATRPALALSAHHCVVRSGARSPLTRTAPAAPCASG